MKNNAMRAVAALTFVGLFGACSDGGLNYSYADFENLVADYPSVESTYTSDGNLPDGTASYAGFAMLGQSDPNSSYLGRLDVTVDFDASSDHITGSITEFAQFADSEGEFTDAMIATDGSFDIAGDLSGSNTALGGLSGTATGALDGTEDTMSFAGHFSGQFGEAIFMLFEGSTFAGGGLAER